MSDPAVSNPAVSNRNASKPAGELGMIERWMQAVIMHPGGVEEGIASDEAQEHLPLDGSQVEQVVSRSRALTGVQRLEVYAQAYYSRLLECLRDEFPVLAATLGQQTFDEFAVGYLQSYPSRSYTLARLGASFARHLEETRPGLEESGGERETWPDFLIDLARLEWTFNEVFDGPGAENLPPLTAEQVQSIPAERWADTRLAPVPCLRLLRLRFPVNAYFTAMKRREEPELPEPADSYVAVTRRDYIVRRYDLSRPQHDLLAGLLAGQTLGEAIEAAAEQAADLDAFAADLRNWFAFWTKEGFFTG